MESHEVGSHFFMSLCANTLAVTEPLHYFAYIKDKKTEAQKGHVHNMPRAGIQTQAF